MTDLETVETFLELRAQDKSLRTIERAIGIDRRTLARWDREFKEELENRKAIELEALHEQYWVTRQARIKIYDAQYRRVTEELEKRDLSEIKTPKLVDLALKLDARLREETLTTAIADEAGLEARKAARSLVESLDGRCGQTESLNDRSISKNGNGKVKGEDLVKLQVSILQRYEAGEIDGRTAAIEMGMVNSIFKGIEIADLQVRLERVEVALGAGHNA